MKTIEIGGVWLVCHGDGKVKVLVGVDGVLRIAIPWQSVAEGLVSHFVHPEGIANAEPDLTFVPGHDV